MERLLKPRFSRECGVLCLSKVKIDIDLLNQEKLTCSIQQNCGHR
jgi:hypothetical protein